MPPRRSRRIDSARARSALQNRTCRGAVSEQWLIENDDAIAHYNAFVEDHGVFSDDWRRF